MDFEIYDDWVGNYNYEILALLEIEIISPRSIGNWVKVLLVFERGYSLVTLISIMVV
jgi:hypothetical protein